MRESEKQKEKTTAESTKRPQQINRENIHQRKEKPADQLSYLVSASLPTQAKLRRVGLVKITQVDLGDLSK